MRARIAAAEPATAVSNRLHTARLYKDSTEARHVEVLKSYRTAQERLAAESEQHLSVMDRLLGRQPTAGHEDLGRELAAVRANLIAAERAATSAQANLTRVERVEATEHSQWLSRMEAERRMSLDALAEIVMAQRIVRAFPFIVYCGPAFVSWAGSKVERKRRRGLRNPQAKTIWSLPVDFG